MDDVVVGVLTWAEIVPYAMLDIASRLAAGQGVGLVRSRREYLPGEEETVELVSVEQAS